MKFKKAFCAILCLGIITSAFSGCGNNAAKPTAKTTAGSKEPITFSLLYCETGMENLDDKFQSPVSKKVTELTGVTLKREFLIGEERQKLALLASSGDYPDMMFTTISGNVIKDAGGFVQMDDLIEKKGANIKKLYGKYVNRMRWSIEDPHIYVMGNSSVYEQILKPEAGFELQFAALKELGYPKVESLQDYENVIKSYIQKHPTIDGKPTIGLSLCAEDWRIKITVTNPATYATGKPDDGEWYYDTVNDKAVLHLTTPEEKEYFRWLNHMNDTGLLDPESFIQKFDQYESKIASGRVIGLTDALWHYESAQTNLISSGKEDRAYAMFPAVMDPKTQKNAAFRPSSFTGGYGISITTSCKDPERAFEYLDWCCTKEAQILFNWGVEGLHYDIIDGKRVVKPGLLEQGATNPNFVKETGIGANSYPFPGYGIGAKDENGEYWQPNSEELEIKTLRKAEKEALAAYGAKLWKDIYPTKDNFKEIPYGTLWKIPLSSDSEGNLIMKKYEELTARSVPEAVMAKPSEFDKVWDNYQAELKDIGIDKLYEEFNSLMQNQKKLWNE